MSHVELRMEEHRRRRYAAMENARKSNQSLTAKVYAENRRYLELRKDTEIPPLSREQLEAVNAFWKRYSFAFQNDPVFQTYYTYTSGTFNPAYCPDGLLTYYLHHYYDSAIYHTAFQDKNYREFLFKDSYCSPAVGHCVAGIFYERHFQQIGYAELMLKLEKYSCIQHQTLIVKPTPGGRGVGIRFIEPGTDAGEIAGIIDQFAGKDLIIERRIEAHPSYAAVNPTSLNTLRIVTLYDEGSFQVLSIALRMGATGKQVDNLSQGGIACAVSPEGVCDDHAFDMQGTRYTEHPNGFRFPGHRLCSVKEAAKLTEKLHRRIPQFRQMSWDIAIDPEGEPLLIEMNPRGDADLYQTWGVLPFAEKTGQVLDEYLRFRFFRLGADMAWDWKEYHDHIVLTRYDGLDTSVTVPEQIGGKTVTEIAPGCFHQTGVEQLTVPGCVKKLCTLPGSIQLVQLPDERGLTVAAPEELKAVFVGGKMRLRWTVTDPEAYTYVYRMQIGGKRTFIRMLMPGISTFEDQHIVPGAAYQYAVRAYRSNTGIFSDWRTARTVVAGQKTVDI